MRKWSNSRNEARAARIQIRGETMASPMQRVSTSMSKDIGDYLTNRKAWGPVMYNVLEHGLKGDGKTDDTAALQKLIDAVIKEGRKAIFFPHTSTGGEYFVTSLTNADQVMFFGDNSKFVGGYTGEIRQLGDLATSEQLAETLSQIFNVKVGYDAKGDGINDDTPAIQSCLNAAKTRGGGDIYFPDGTYVIKSIIKIPSNVRLLFAKNATVLRMAHIDAMFMNDSDGTLGGYEANRNIAIIGGTFDANKSGFATYCTTVGVSHCEHIYLEGCTFINNYSWHCIELNATKNAKVINCKFLDYGTPATVGGSEMIQLDHAFQIGFPWFGPYDNTPCQDVIIESCLFENGVDGIGTHSGILDVLHNNVKIVNNTFRNLTGWGITALNYQNHSISSNVIEDCGNGIRSTISAGNILENVEILHNKITNSTTRAIWMANGHRRGKIIGNYVNTTGTHGIGCDVNEDIIIEENQVYNVKTSGIWSYGTNGCSIINNISKRGTTSDPTSFDILAGVFTGSGILTSNNIIQGNQVDKILIQNVKNVILTHNIVTTVITESGTNENIIKERNIVAGISS